MKIIIDDAIHLGLVYSVKMKIVQGRSINYFETTFNIKQKEVAITRAIKRLGCDADKIDSIEITMQSECGISNF